MKKLLLLSLVILTANAGAQYWPIHYYGGRWIRIKVNPNPQPSTYRWEVSGGVSTNELNQVGLLDMGSGAFDYGYFEFYGESEYSMLNGPVLDFPPGFMNHDGWITYPHPNEFAAPQFAGGGFCNCDCVAPTPDTSFPADAFGFWIEDPNLPWNIWAINHGYVRWTNHMEVWMKIPCPPAPAFYKPNDPLFFTDSAYVPLPDGVVLSGDSHLYLMAVTHPDVPPYLNVDVFLESGSSDTAVVHMVYIDTLNEWHGMAGNSRSLGLKSYNTAVAKSYSDNAADSATARVAVALPRILTRFGDAFTDTVFIRSDSMVVSKDLKVYLQFYDDANDNESMDLGLIDSAGYKYKSRWIANANYSPDHDSTYYRKLPVGATIYKWWDKNTDSCLVSFRRDSLYTVGGELTIECVGALDSLKDIDNRFRVDTDTLAANHIDTLQTKMIIIDTDPTNDAFKNRLIGDHIRAIAWKEGAGTIPEPGHPHSHNPWNHYWFDTFTPCENTRSTASGIMQIVRRWWEVLLNTNPAVPDTGYTKAQWDSMAWNWQICIRDGKFIYDVYNPNRYESKQKLFPDSCSFDSCGDCPCKKNKEDLKTYAYHTNYIKMQKILTDKDWNNIIGDTTTINEEKQYVRDVRKFRYDKPWK